MPYIKHSFGKTFYTSKGRLKDGIPIIWLHGGPGGMHNPDSSIFKKIKNRKIYLYDQIGGGKSSQITFSKMKIETFVFELKTLTKAWGLTQFHLAGNSWGATLALEYYLRTNGKGVVSLIFQSPFFSAIDWMRDANRLIKKLPKKNQKIIKYCHEIGATDSEVYKGTVENFNKKHCCRIRIKNMKRRKKKKFDNSRGGKVYEYMWGPSEFFAQGILKNYHQVDRLKEIKVPTLILVGKHDEATPETAKNYAKKIIGANFKVIKNASHAIPEENPKEFWRVVTAFLKNINCVNRF